MGDRHDGSSVDGSRMLEQHSLYIPPRASYEAMTHTYVD